MNVRLYEPRDFESIKSWAETGWDTSYTEDFFPALGFIVDDVAAVFIYQTDSKVCFIENMISNREACPAKKNVALDLLIREAFATAKELGFLVAYATTDNPKVIARGIRMGAHAEPHHALLTKNLKDLST